MTTFWGPDFDALRRTDPEIAEVLLDELERQRSRIQLIASENFASPAVLAANGSVLTNKYAEAEARGDAGVAELLERFPPYPAPGDPVGL